ncbi:hypothetical protein CG471_11825 [Sphingobium sp. IP1]|uniref:hypothetical protein n=1 Tax=Sphingobium sp. IP1 TaxID=2021637 RepID=UPI000C0A8600|nr:hypothetical protein [Sphingobium sp. IP1]PHP19541.1 hypothetical protein CG471_11825 [Sphingobium sp. IP1]
MTPVMLARLCAASDFVLDEIRKATPAEEIIAALVADHRATFRRGDPTVLRVAGVSASCTHDAGSYLLDRWRANAVNKIVMEKANG